MRILLLISIVMLYEFISSSFGSVDQDAWIAPEATKNLINPIENNVQSVMAGKKIFDQQCWSCHGKSGLGDGPASRALKNKPADFSNINFQNQKDGEIFWKISEGRGEMAGYKNALKEEKRWQLVNYLRTIKK